MKLRLVYVYPSKEAEAILHLLNWQQIPISKTEDAKLCLHLSKGKKLPVVLNNGKPIAIGFKELYEYLNTNGLFLM